MENRQCGTCGNNIEMFYTSPAGVFCSSECEENKSKEFYNQYCSEIANKVSEGEISIPQGNNLKRNAMGGHIPCSKEIETKAKSFLDNIINENKNKISKINGGWLVKGNVNQYFITRTGEVWIFDEDAGPTQKCIESRNSSNIHLYDVIASRMLSLINDENWISEL